jgi:fibro-slime domain-containing protein
LFIGVLAGGCSGGVNPVTPGVKTDTTTSIDAHADVRVSDGWLPPPVPDSGTPDVPTTPINDCGDACFDPVDAGPVCGNGVLDDGELCDDGNSRPGDGCSGLCRKEPNYTCRVPGQPCEPDPLCGDGKLTPDEQCDDGNPNNGDGCSSTCKLESGCTANDAGAATCPPKTVCGDGIITTGEQCDDGNVWSSDGCSDTCQAEKGWKCVTPGSPCVRDEYCGDGVITAAKGEQCDDGNALAGDGCTGTCQIEPFYKCPPEIPGTKCQSTIVCGDGKIIGDEACDDSNTKAGDGCSADCKQVEPGYVCPNANGVGGACTLVPQETCGDAKLSYGEQCDDGNALAGDGCSATCQVEQGYRCPEVGKKCVLVAVCGDAKLSVADGEQCDDANKTSGDGCSSTCFIEADYVCPTPGQKCVSTIVCGDGRISGTETCDDGNTRIGDGCSATCQIEAGWTCPAGSVCRPTKCGDGIRVGTEQCDDGNTNSGDGCSPQCRVETPSDTEGNGWTCPTAGQACTRTTCGNGTPEGSEQCDDGNNDMGDSCTPFCRKEPSCPSGGGACSTACGDGLLLTADLAAGQECDDGNTLNGDGCSATCKVESGYVCEAIPVVKDPFILPIIYRDFKAAADPGGHADFESVQPATTDFCLPGIAAATLGADGKPAHGTTPQTPGFTYPSGTSDSWFALWYKDSTYAQTVIDTLAFTKLASGAYQYNKVNNDFYPVDGKGWNTGSGGRNFHFTSEVRYWFEYRGGEKLEFTGDDDVFVFINKKLAVDLGGVHWPYTGSVTLGASNGTGVVCDMTSESSLSATCGDGTSHHLVCDAPRTVDFGLTKGSVYEIVVFQAERHTSGSDYQLTLSNFSASRSSCHTVCGDGFVTSDEACDLGGSNNSGAYGTCNQDCTRPAYCGDATVNGPAGVEQCDDGVNRTSYGGTAKKCGSGCKWAPYCGNGKPDTAYGEACDEGADNGKGYGHCTTSCTLGPRCGDGLVTDAEECDHAAQNGMPGDKCSATCTWNCGNGTVDQGEQCDNGKAANTGGYGKCKADCTWGPRCGDGIKNGTEECDDGVNDGAYGGCAPGCVLGPRCGDNITQANRGETCDKGSANSATAYGKDTCTNRCQVAPFCGDKAVDGDYAEKCDDGVNSGEPGSCTTDCSAFVPLPSCGDGTVQPPEKCDQGALNGTQGATCDKNCRTMCGNGVKDPGEECDDGVNDGTYGSCTPDCKMGGYCGDGIKNGSEQCDNGTANLANPYGKGKCSTSCTSAPYCGDAHVQSSFGEECDGSRYCDSTCKSTIVQ